MANLLQKASIVLTPTAYDDGKVLCAKPSEPPYGDFDFSRNSAATRVNAQGLVENVQILSSNLVQNGDFSEEGAEEVSNGSFSQEGVQLITNGSFDTDSDWTKGTGWSISGGSANCDGVSSNSSLYQNVGGVNNTIYKITGTISNYVSGTLQVGGSSNFLAVNSNGDFVHYRQWTSDSTLYLKSVNFIGSIDNVSCVEVAQDWDLGTGWSIGEDKASSDGSQTSNSSLFQSNVLTQNKYYKFEFTLSNVTSGAVRLRNGIGDYETYISYQNSNGTYTAYSIVNSSNKTLVVDADSSFIGSITNISVKEVGQNWVFSSGAFITDIGARLTHTPTAGTITSLGYSPLVIGNNYKMTYEITESISGGIKLNSAVVNTMVSTIGIHTKYFEATGNSISFARTDPSGNDVTIDNISVIEITDDTNLPRINYEGFSYQDVLGSELVTNGGFDTDSNWSKIGNVSISGGSANFIDNGSNLYSYIRQNISQINGKKYLIDFEIKNYSFGVLQVILQSSGIANTYNSNGKYSIVVESSVSNGYVEFSRNFDGGTFSFSIDNVSVKEYLGQEVVPDSGCGSWLFEPQSTNLIPYSEDFSNADWNANTDVIIDKGYLAPDGTNNASKITADGANAKVALFVNGVGPYTKSIYARTVSGTGTLYLGEGFPSGTAVLSNVTEQWQRFEVTNTLSNFYGADFRGASTLTEVIIWGAQFEDNISYATSYIPTSGTTVTRNQDVCTNGGSLASINSTEGVLYAEIAKNSLSNNNQISISLNSGSTNNRVMFFTGANDQRLNCQVRSGGSNEYSSSFDFSAGSTNFNKIAIKYKENDFSFWVNGSKITQAATGVTPLGLNELAFDVGSSANNFFGKTKALAVWKEALSDAELADLTYPTPTDPTFALDFDTIATDFTFARGSEATYVDAQGLIQSTNELGPEEITNGDFSTDGIPSTTSWSLGWYSQTSNVLISGGKLTLTNSASQSTALAYATDGVSSLNVVTVNKTYKLQYRVIENNGVTSFKYYSAGGSFIVAPTDLGVTHTIYIKNTANQIFLFQNATTNSSISIDNVSIKEYITATNTPRLDYSTGAEAFLLEPQSTNLITYSEDFSQWGYSGDITVESGYLAPDGTNNAYKISGTTSALTLGGASETSTRTIYARTISGTGQANLCSFNQNTNNFFTVTEQWQRFEVNGAIATGGTTFYAVDFRGNTNLTDILIWGAQSEALSYATSYIPTSGTSVTRNQETCINATPEINSEEGVLYAEIAALANDGTFRMISISDGTNNNRIRVNYSATNNHIQSRVVVGGVTQAEINKYGFLNITDFTKIAISYKENEVKLYINGQLIGTDTSATMPSANIFNVLNFNGAISNNFFGNTKDLQVYTKALSDAELIKLTT